MLPSLFALLSSRLFTMESFVNTTLCSIKTKVGWREDTRFVFKAVEGPPLGRGAQWGEPKVDSRPLAPPAVHLYVLPEPHSTPAPKPRPASPGTENHRVGNRAVQWEG